VTRDRATEQRTRAFVAYPASRFPQPPRFVARQPPARSMATPQHPHRKAIAWLQGPIEEYCIRPVEMAGSMSRSTGQKLREIPSQDGCGQVSVLFKRAFPESSFLLVRDGRCPPRDWQLRYCADMSTFFGPRARACTQPKRVLFDRVGAVVD
jgi:hypothetical protein